MDVHGRDLRYFVAVAEELHFTRAAERMYVSQPALSKQIRMLERQLGAPLFDRGRQGVRLTPVARRCCHMPAGPWPHGTSAARPPNAPKAGSGPPS